MFGIIHHQEYGTGRLNLCNLQFNMATKSDCDIHRREKSVIKFSLTFNISQFRCSLLEAASVSKIFIQTLVGSLGGSRHGCMIFVNSMCYIGKNIVEWANSAAPCAVLNFLFLSRELLLLNRDNALQECSNP